MKRILTSLLIAAGLLVSLGAAQCDGIPEEVRVETATLATCKSYSATLRAVSVFRPSMTPEQEATVDNLNAVAGPICLNAQSGTTSEATLAALRDALRAMATVQAEVES